ISADNQDITAAGMCFYIQKYKIASPIVQTKNKKELIQELLLYPNALVILDYTLFDFYGPEELIILNHRFPQSHFLLFSEELTDDFLKKITCGMESFSILTKDCSEEEVIEALSAISNCRSYICQRISSQLTKKTINPEANTKLTPTEREIVRLIALGKSTKEIANERFLSIHTVITHRKNIFRKLEINNLQEATKYALRAGIIDASDYYI
ncbi:MAG: response regulator transcription factor, partial [Dysgonamonadaceae bacterium]|nr:response regulator transcription factor [Dysgonamonadaceae bacterium]